MNKEKNSLDKTNRYERANLHEKIHRALARKPRRQVLPYLLMHEQSTLDELTKVLCGWELEADVMVSQQQYEQIQIRLYHVHLPQLADADLIKFDPSEGSVVLTDTAKETEQFLNGILGVD